MRVAAAVALLCWCTAAAAADGDPGTLVLLAQGDATLASEPVAPADPPDGATFRVRRVRVGEDLGGRLFHVRGVLEAVSADGLGTYYTPVEGGRLMGPLRLTAATASWTPHVLLRVDAGLIRVPFSLSRQIDQADLRMPERAAMTNTLAPDFRAGGGFSGDAGALSWAVAAMSASRTIDGDLFDRGAMVAARMAAEPIGPVGTTPWRRPLDDPWSDWLRFRHGLSFMYGTLYEAKTIGAGTDLSLQWRRFSGTAEYIFVHTPSGDQQGAVVEPGITLGPRRVDVVLRGAWQRAGGANGWGGGGAITIYARDPRARVQVAFQHSSGPAPLPSATSALARITFALN
jgi:hypothetical protein